jgi:hypothetical protein
MNGKEKLPKCVICKTVIDFLDEGGHIYPDGSVTCALCESDYEAVLAEGGD